MPSQRKRRRGLSKVLSRLLALGLVGGGLFAVAAFTIDLPGLGRGGADAPLSVVVRRDALAVIVTERGSLESMITVDGICEVQGHQNKIIFLVPEGTHVEKGSVVCRFDSTEIDKNIAQQQIKVKQAQGKVATTQQDISIQKNDGESKVQEAEVEHKLAKINLTKYVEGDYRAELADTKGNIALNKQKLEEAADKREQYRDLVKKGFKSLEQLRAVEQEHSQYLNFSERDQLKLKVKEEYEFEAKTTEMQSKVDQAANKIKRSRATLAAQVAKAESEFEAATSTLGLESQQLEEFTKQKQYCEIKAEQSGVVAYANNEWFDSSRQIREGAMVYTRQKIFSLPDMSKMQIVVNVHESLIKKVKAGQDAEIRIDAFPALVLAGKVKSVSQLADSNRSWMSGGAKVYKTIVTIEKMPEEDLRPGMNAEVKVLVNTIKNALIVPMQAVAERKGVHYAFVITGVNQVERRTVEVGETSEKHVQVVKGLSEGERVALDARARVEAEFKNEEEKEQPSETTKPQAAPAAPDASPGIQ